MEVKKEAAPERKSSPPRGINVEECVYYDPITDPTRPRYDRPKGEIGIAIDVYDTATVDPKEFHSHHALLSNISDRFYDLIHDFPLDKLKGVFMELDLLNGVIFEKIHKGIIIAVSMESPEAISNLWDAHSSDELHRLLQQTLISPDVLEKVGVTAIDLRVRLWEDEKQDCIEYLNETRPSPTLKDNYMGRTMVDKVKDYAKVIPESIWTLRDEQQKFYGDLSEMLRLLKTVLPGNKDTITTLEKYDKCCGALSTKPQVNMAAFQRYKTILASVKEKLKAININIVYSIYQIHNSLETEKQQQNKKKIRDTVKKSLQCLSPDFEISTLRHPEWHGRLLANEERFMGFVCLIPLMVDAVADIDGCLDEYMSGFK